MPESVVKSQYTHHGDFDRHGVYAFQPYTLPANFVEDTFSKPPKGRFFVVEPHSDAVHRWEQGRWICDPTMPFCAKPSDNMWLANIEDGVVLGKGLIVDHGKPLRYHERFTYVDDAYVTASLERKSTRLDGPVFSTVQPHTWWYCHWIFEALPKLLAFRDECGHAIVLHDDREFVRQFLDYLGIPSRGRLALTHESSPIHARSVLFASGLSCHDVPQRHLEAIQQAFRVPSRPGELGILIDRRPLTRRWGMKLRTPHVSRGLFNHRQLYRALRKAFPKLHWKVFHPETDLKTMLNLFANARVIVGSHGAGLANLAFAPKNCAVVEISPAGSELTFAVLSHLLGNIHKCVAPNEPATGDAKGEPVTAPIEAVVDEVGSVLRFQS
jgi:hypothetical protein